MPKGKFPGLSSGVPRQTYEPHLSDSLKAATEELFSMFFMCSPVGLYVVQDGKFRIVNPRFQENIGFREEELVNRDSLSFVIPEYRERVRENAIRMLKGERTAPYEFMVTTRQDQQRWIMETVTSIQYLGKRAAFGNFMDITDRKLAEEALSQSEQLYRAVIQQAAETICVIDVKSKLIIEFNPAFRELLGYSGDHLRSMTLYDFIGDDASNISQNVEKIVGSGEHFLGERFWRKSDGSFAEMEVSANSIFYAGRQALCVVARDISDRKNAERQRKFLTQRLISVGEDERKKLARDLHDDLGQMLTALRFVLDALDESLPDNLEGQGRKCREALSFVEQISNSVRTILFELHPSLLDDLGLVPTLQWYIARFMGHGPSVKVTFDAFGIKRRLDREKEVVLFRIFQECLNNVIKHASAENVQASLTYSYPKIIFVVKDDGIGFRQGAQVSRSKDGCQGIGLLGMRERVDSIGGSFEVISSLGTGTTVRVELDDSKEETDE